MKPSILLFISIYFASTLFGQNQEITNSSTERLFIGKITVEGADNYDQSAIKVIAGLNEGMVIHIPGDEISNAIQNLWNEKLFADVHISIKSREDDMVHLLVELTTLPTLSRFRFEGIGKREADKLREEIKLFSGKTITKDLVFTTEAKIRSFFKQKGFHATDVHIYQSDDPIMDNSKVLTIVIDKKKRVKIGEINFEDVESIKTRRLKMAMRNTKQKTFWRFYRRSKFIETDYRDDKLAVLNEYNKIGLRDAEIVKDSVYLAHPDELQIDLKIDEGEVYYFGNIEWVGNTKFSSGFLDTVLGIRSGDIYNKELFDQRLFMSMDGRDVSSLYMDRGYLFFRLIPIEKSIVENKVNYQIRIIEGKQARVRNVIIKGNTVTKEHVIRREIRTKPGDLFNRNDIIRTQRELAQLGYFNPQGFQVNPIPNPQDGTVDIEYIVQEQSGDKFELSGSIGGNGTEDNPTRLIGSAGFSFQNFSVKNMFKGKDQWSPIPMGDGQTLQLRMSSTTNFLSGMISFTEPWLGGKRPNALSVWSRWDRNGNTWRMDDPEYSGIEVVDIGVSLGRRRKWPDDFFSESFQLNYKYYHVTNASSFVAFENGYANDLSLGYTLQRNNIDNPIYPKKGSKFVFTGKASLPYSLFDGVSDYSNFTDQERYKYLEYYKMKLTGEWYLPLTPNKKLVLMPRFGFGYIGSYSASKGLTPFERFSMGGNGMFGSANSLNGQESIALRGYENGALSSLNGDPLIAKYSLELRYPISLNPQFTAYALAFAEAGNTFPTLGDFNPFNVKKSAGIGLRMYVPMFGLIGIDYGIGFDRLDSWSQGAGDHNDIMDSQGYSTKLNFTLGFNIGEL
ncbi:MAG: outer membrane protein assembly factor [Crocinitomicaceae bacterium]